MLRREALKVPGAAGLQESGWRAVRHAGANFSTAASFQASRRYDSRGRDLPSWRPGIPSCSINTALETSPPERIVILYSSFLSAIETGDVPAAQQVQ